MNTSTPSAVEIVEGDEAAAVIADRDWWRDWGAQFGWTLYGFSYRDYATFILSTGGRLEVPAHAKQDIDRAIALAGGE